MAKKKVTHSHKFVKGLLIFGMLVSLFLVYEHFAPSASKFCNFGESMDCGIVNKSPYATLDGFSYLMTIDWGWSIPLINISGIHWFFELITANAFLGFLTLIFVFYLLKAHERNEPLWWIHKDKTKQWATGILLFGVLYGAYLFYIQHSILQTYCIFCLLLDLTLLTSFIILWRTK